MSLRSRSVQRCAVHRLIENIVGDDVVKRMPRLRRRSKRFDFRKYTIVTKAPSRKPGFASMRRLFFQRFYKDVPYNNFSCHRSLHTEGKAKSVPSQLTLSRAVLSRKLRFATVRRRPRWESMRGIGCCLRICFVCGRESLRNFSRNEMETLGFGLMLMIYPLILAKASRYEQARSYAQDIH